MTDGASSLRSGMRGTSNDDAKAGKISIFLCAEDPKAGIAGIDFFSEWKTVYIDYSGALQRAQIDND